MASTAGIVRLRHADLAGLFIARDVDDFLNRDLPEVARRQQVLIVGERHEVRVFERVHDARDGDAGHAEIGARLSTVQRVLPSWYARPMRNMILSVSCSRCTADMRSSVRPMRR